MSDDSSVAESIAFTDESLLDPLPSDAGDVDSAYESMGADFSDADIASVDAGPNNVHTILSISAGGGDLDTDLPGEGTKGVPTTSVGNHLHVAEGSDDSYVQSTSETCSFEA